MNRTPWGWTTRLLSSDDDLAAYARSYNALLGLQRYRADDLRGLHVRGFFRGGRLVGGYAVNDRPPYAYVTLIPEAQRAGLAFDVGTARLAEIRALWLHPRAPNVLRAALYVRSVLDAAAFRPDYVVGGAFVEQVRRTQMRALPHLLWEGVVEGQGVKQHAWFFYARPWEAVLRTPYASTGGWWDRMRRRVQKRSRQPAVRPSQG